MAINEWPMAIINPPLKQKPCKAECRLVRISQYNLAALFACQNLYGCANSKNLKPFASLRLVHKTLGHNLGKDRQKIGVPYGAACLWCVIM